MAPLEVSVTGLVLTAALVTDAFQDKVALVKFHSRTLTVCPCKHTDIARKARTSALRRAVIEAMLRLIIVIF
jgi:hypothetical protein